MRTFNHLTQEERYHTYLEHNKNVSLGEIAKNIGRKLRVMVDFIIPISKKGAHSTPYPTAIQSLFIFKSMDFLFMDTLVSLKGKGWRTYISNGCDYIIKKYWGH